MPPNNERSGPPAGNRVGRSSAQIAATQIRDERNPPSGVLGAALAFAARGLAAIRRCT